jgi:hypothetical protein
VIHIPTPDEVADIERLGHRTHALVEKWGTDEAFLLGGTPDETVDDYGNALMASGSAFLWQCAMGNGGAGTLLYLTTTNAALGIGDNAVATTRTQTDFLATTNTLRKAATSVTNTDVAPPGVVGVQDRITVVTSFISTEANWVWAEWALFNSPTTGRMINRRVPTTNLGSKTSGTWQLTVTIDLT